MFDINEYFKTATKNGFVFEPVECKDGFKVSIQASHSHYCTPRKDDAEYYTHVELGFPNMIPPDYILEYAEDEEYPTDTVYAYVPVELVNQMIDLHNQ
jgi:hypothetical protein